MALNNKVILIGNLGSDAELIKTEKSEFVSMSLCTQDSYKKDDEWIKKEPVWHKITVFNKYIIPLAKRLKKGERIEVIGEITYVDKEREGINYKEARINATSIEDACNYQNQNKKNKKTQTLVRVTKSREGNNPSLTLPAQQC